MRHLPFIDVFVTYIHGGDQLVECGPRLHRDPAEIDLVLNALISGVVEKSWPHTSPNHSAG